MTFDAHSHLLKLFRHKDAFGAESWFSFCTEMAENWGGMTIAHWKSKVQHFTGTLSNGQIYSDIIIYTHRDWNAGSWQEAGTCLLAYCITCLPELLPLLIQWGWQWGTEACSRVMVHQAYHATGIVSFKRTMLPFLIHRKIQGWKLGT